MEDNITDLIIGEFTHTVFRSESYMVSRFSTEDDNITVTGPAFDYEKGQKYLLTGNYVDHPRYGFQFSILTIERYLPDKRDDIISFLAGKTFKGIGKKAAEKIYDHFGDDTLQILKDDPSKIAETSLSEKQYQSIIDGFSSLSEPENDTLFYLASNGFNNLEAQKIFNRFKLATVEVGKDNPFRFYNDVYGISFDKVKNYASKIEFSDQELKYKEAFLIYLMNDYTFRTGNTYIERDVLESILMNYGGMDIFLSAYERALGNGYLTIEEDQIYLTQDHTDEHLIASFLKRFPDDLVLDDDLIEENIAICEKQLSIVYDDKQKEAIRCFFRKGISIIIGGPGTGKTTIVKTMVSIFRECFAFSNLIVAAPTGRAAKRINEICGCESKTIHSLLKWNKETNIFSFNEENPLLYDALIIDEFSMVDNSLFASLLRASSRIKKICIIGDNNQLPSIRPGDLLSDLIASEMFTCTKLEYNYRQRSGNEIISLANDIIRNDVDLKRYNNDIKFYDVRKDTFDLISLIREDLDNGFTLDDIQILSPMYKGEWGIDNLNLLLQNTFNPGGFAKKEKKVGQFIFRVDDKILQLKNRPNDDVYNGDIGILEDIDEKEKCLTVDYDNTIVFYQFDDLSDIALAYAMSVHKAQGSEYPIVYFIINRNNIRMLNRKLIYTAISRAKNKLVIIGESSLFMNGLANLLKKRQTGLMEKLENETD